jgi:DNA-directed RNA polymerase subunit N (RpoN/RPB10)
MIIPVRCFSCGKPIGGLWEQYKEEIKTLDKKEVLDNLGLKRFCCRGILLGHIDSIEIIGEY